jgi:hypothetical protein|tara:strand:- start:977 stop:1225 length:249 start_codon:yes stop_codon:yes gene_type:complete
MIDVEKLDLRTLQTEAAKVLASYLEPTNNGLAEINKKCNHDSTIFYKEVLKLYIEEFGDLPSKAGPGQQVQLFSEKIEKKLD